MSELCISEIDLTNEKIIYVMDFALIFFFFSCVIFKYFNYCFSTVAGVLIILQERLAKLLSGNEIKCMQKILVSLGHISFNETSFPHLQSALDLIFGISRSKVGQSLVWLSPSNYTLLL